MNTLTHEHAVETKRESTVGAKAKGPLELFENQAHAIWLSDLTPSEKALKFYAVSDSITKYLQKIDAQLAERAQTRDAWSNCACTRATSYLAQLASDLRKLANQCQSTVH